MSIQFCIYNSVRNGTKRACISHPYWISTHLHVSCFGGHGGFDYIRNNISIEVSISGCCICVKVPLICNSFVFVLVGMEDFILFAQLCFNCFISF